MRQIVVPMRYSLLKAPVLPRWADLAIWGNQNMEYATIIASNGRDRIMTIRNITMRKNDIVIPVEVHKRNEVLEDRVPTESGLRICPDVMDKKSPK